MPGVSINVLHASQLFVRYAFVITFSYQFQELNRQFLIAIFPPSLHQVTHEKF